MAGAAEDRLADALGHRFARAALLEEALTHSSAAGPSRARRDYERLEFLGDRVLGLVIADALLERYPKSDAGQLARRFNALVCREALAEVAEEIDLGRHIVMAAGEHETGGREKPGILADACEALIGALFLDGGLEAARAFIQRYWRPMIDDLRRAPKDAKTRLQEWAQARGRPLPVYREMERSGPDHAPSFTIEVAVEGEPAVAAAGASKRAAEHEAAAEMLRALAAAGKLDDD